MTLSIIIPVYNVERYIEGTLNSVYSQNVDEHLFEVIVVDDGTPDNSMVIVERYAKCHSNMTVIHQANQGLSCARNSGLRVAKGDYIWFVDSDDQLSKDGISQVIECIKKTPADIIGFNMVKQHENTGEESVQKAITRPKYYHMYDEVLNCYDILYKAHSATVPSYVFKHSFIEGNGLNFYPGIIHEDNEFMARAYFLANSIIFKDIEPYRYLIRTSGSIMSDLNMKSVYSRRTIIDSIMEFSNHHCKTFKQRIYMKAILLGLTLGLLDYQYDSAEYRTYIKEHYSLIRKLAWEGVLANIFVGSAPKIVKGIMVFVNPLWYKNIMNKRKKTIRTITK